MAEAICGLLADAARPGHQLPAVDPTSSYRLSFAACLAAFPLVDWLTAGGCGGVSGACLVRRATSAASWTARSWPGPWAALTLGAATLKGTS